MLNRDPGLSARARVALAAVAVALIAPDAALAQSAAVRVANNLASPVYVAAPEGDSRLFIVERAGRIKVLANGSVLGPSFLDITDRVELPNPSEGGLLSMAFDPNYAANGVFYVYYTGEPSQGGLFEKRIARFVAANPASSEPVLTATESILFRQEQSPINHLGGTIAIRDGYLYLGLGDGGGDGEVAQSDASAFGKFLRFDIAQQQVPWSYEIWAKGFRNPFRWSFDRDTGDLYIGDVGQATIEEVDVQPADGPAGLNYGWDVMEGSNCFDPDPGEPPCFSASFETPAHEYSSADPACGVTGGSVYRGRESPSLRGLYFFIDLCASRLTTFRWNPATGLAEDVTDRTDEFPPDAGSLFQVVAIAEDGFGELYAVSLLGGSVHKLVPEPGAALLGAVACASLACVARRRARA